MIVDTCVYIVRPLESLVLVYHLTNQKRQNYCSMTAIFFLFLFLEKLFKTRAVHIHCIYVIAFCP